jgi:hypothetical protein
MHRRSHPALHKDRRANLAEQTVVTLWETLRIKPMVHLPISQPKAVLGGPTQGSAEPQGRLNLDGFLAFLILAGRSILSS